MELLEHYPLREHNTFGLEANARLFAEVSGTGQLLEVLDYSRQIGIGLFILGGGSNILLMGDLDKIVVKNNIGGIRVLEEDADRVRVEVGGGVVWHDFVVRAVSEGWGGVENLSLIPGTVGASPIQNIGAYGVEIKDVFESLVAIETETGASRVFQAEDCRFGYRDSIFKQDYKGKWIIAAVTFRLHKSDLVNTNYGDIRSVLASWGIDQPGIADVSRAVISIRQRKLPDPAQIGNAGSFFKNPEVPGVFFSGLKSRFPTLPGYEMENSVKIPAGWLIEAAGWKGYREGRVGVHDKQALVLVNHGGATGAEIKELALKIQSSVQEKFEILLQPEVNYV